MISFKSTLRAAFTAATVAFIHTPSTQAQQVQQVTPTNIGGGVFINNSTLTGSASAAGIKDSIVTSTAVGANNLVNPYGGYSSITGTTSSSVSFLSLGYVQISGGSILTSGNVSAAGLNGSILDQSAFGYTNKVDGVGQVTQVSGTINAAPVTNLGVASIQNSTITRGDVSAAGGSAIFGGDDAIGQVNLSNNYGGYNSTTGTITASTPSTGGSIYINGSTLGASNVSAVDLSASVITQSAAGSLNTQQSVGTVIKYTAQTLGLQ